jgi:hypothetical protein
MAVGYEAPEFVAFLVQNTPEIEAIKLFRPVPPRPIQEESSIRASEQELINRALGVRKNMGLPFWDSLFLCLSSQPASVENVIRRATLHNSQDSDSFILQRDDCTDAQMRKLIEALPAGVMLAISSRVSVKGGKMRHLPMLDFHCETSQANDHLVRLIVTEIGLRGYVARSGRSYHFYGKGLVDEQELISILGKALLFCPIIDRAWIAHQLLERACGLRISPGKDYQNCPKIIYAF